MNFIKLLTCPVHIPASCKHTVSQIYLKSFPMWSATLRHCWHLKPQPCHEETGFAENIIVLCELFSQNMLDCPPTHTEIIHNICGDARNWIYDSDLIIIPRHVGKHDSLLKVGIKLVLSLTQLPSQKKKDKLRLTIKKERKRKKKKFYTNRNPILVSYHRKIRGHEYELKLC